ncbi:Microtubule bundling protein [Rhodotorula kratochvilovae]
MSTSAPSAPPALEELIAAHRTTLNTLYAALSPAPQPLIDAHLAALHSTLSAALSSQRSTAEAEVAAAEERLAAAWARVHDWQQALGEPLRPAKKRGDGPLLALVDEVERIRAGMKGRMEERGTRILALQERLRSLAEVVGREWLEVELEQAAEEGRWEDLNLKLERMGALERETVRCEAEIAHRRDVLNTSTSEIFALRSELGIHQESADGTSSALADPLDEEILWHLGVGDARQPKREIVPTTENVQRVEAKRKWLEDEKDSRNLTIQTTYDKLYPLWTMLGVSEDEMEDFVNRHMGSTLDVVTAYQDELKRMLTLKRSNMSAFIAREREALTALWDALYVSHAQRLAQFPAYAISVEPTRVWNAAHGCEDEVVSENVSEELLVAHERERERLEREVEEARPLLERLAKYFEVVEKTKELEAAAADPSRLMDKSRGAAARLAQEAKDRKRVDRQRPKLEAELRVLIPQWEAANGRPFLINGVGFIQGLDEQIRAEELEKENRKRAKMGASSSSSSARPLRAQHTGGSTLAPLKRQMTGASARSNTSASSSGPPAPKRLAAGSVAPTPAASRIGRPKSALGDAYAHHGYVAATPAPLKAQATGAGTGRARAGTVGAGGVAQTPMSASTAGSGSFVLGASVGGGMRIPHGWGGAAAMSPSLGAPAARAPGLVPQPTGGFRPRG